MNDYGSPEHEARLIELETANRRPGMSGPTSPGRPAVAPLAPTAGIALTTIDDEGEEELHAAYLATIVCGGRSTSATAARSSTATKGCTDPAGPTASCATAGPPDHPPARHDATTAARSSSPWADSRRRRTDPAREHGGRLKAAGRIELGDMVLTPAASPARSSTCTAPAASGTPSSSVRSTAADRPAVGTAPGPWTGPAGPTDGPPGRPDASPVAGPVSARAAPS